MLNESTFIPLFHFDFQIFAFTFAFFVDILRSPIDVCSPHVGFFRLMSSPTKFAEFVGESRLIFRIRNTDAMADKKSNRASNELSWSVVLSP